MMSYSAFCPVPSRVLKTGNNRTVPIRSSSADPTSDDSNLAPGSERYLPSLRYLSNPVSFQAASVDDPIVPFPPSRFSIPNAPGAPSLSKSSVVGTLNCGVLLLLQFWISEWPQNTTIGAT